MSVTGFNARRRAIAAQAEAERLKKAKAEEKARLKAEKAREKAETEKAKQEQQNKENKEADAECQEAIAQSNTQPNTSLDASTQTDGPGQSTQKEEKPSSKQQDK